MPELTDQMVSEVLHAINKLVQADGTYKEKAEMLVAAASKDERSSLEEFMAWVEEIPELDE